MKPGDSKSTIMEATILLNSSSAPINSSYGRRETLCRNAYTDRLILNDTQCSAITAVMILELVITLPLNALMVKGIHKTKMLSSTTWQYILLLGYAGCSLSVVVIPMNIVLFTIYRAKRSCSLEYMAIFLGQINCQFTMYLILLLAMHRYWMTMPSPKLLSSISIKNIAARGFVVAALLLSLLHGGASINFFGTITTSMPNILMKVLDITIGIIVFAIYLRLYIKIRRYIKACRVRFKDDKNVESAVQFDRLGKLPLYMKSLAITIFLILMVLAACYVPFIIMDSWTSWYTFYKSEKAPQKVRFVYYLTYGSVFFTSIANACIVIQRNRDLKLYANSAICMACCNVDVHPAV